jgi:hypothetical protein
MDTDVPLRNLEYIQSPASSDFRAGIQESKPGYPTPAELKRENKTVKFRP